MRGDSWLRALAREGGGELSSVGFEGALRELGRFTAPQWGCGKPRAEVLERILGAPSRHTYLNRLAAVTSIRREEGLSAIGHEAMLDHSSSSSGVVREAIACADVTALGEALSRAEIARSACERIQGTTREKAQYLRAWREGQPFDPKLRDLHLARLESPAALPALVVTPLALADVVTTLVRMSPGRTMVLASPSNHEALKEPGRGAHLTEHGAVIALPVRAPSLKVMRRLLHKADRARVRTVIGIGGGVAQDVAKWVGLGRHVYIVPTVLSSDCSSNGRSVIGLRRAFSCETSTPVAVVASLPTLCSADRPTLSFWAQSGFADLLSELSSELDRVAAGSTTPEFGRTTARRALDWILDEFSEYDAHALEKLLAYVHEVGCEDIVRGTNGDRIGGEHVLYKTLLEVNPSLRCRGSRRDAHQVASHGQICAVGTLITSRLAALESGDGSFDVRLRAALRKLDLPLSFPRLAALGIHRDDLVRALERARSPQWPPSRIGRDWRVAVDPGSLLDDIFGDRAISDLLHETESPSTLSRQGSNQTTASVWD